MYVAPIPPLTVTVPSSPSSHSGSHPPLKSFQSVDTFLASCSWPRASCILDERAPQCDLTILRETKTYVTERLVPGCLLPHYSQNQKAETTQKANSWQAAWVIYTVECHSHEKGWNTAVYRNTDKLQKYYVQWWGEQTRKALLYGFLCINKQDR